jgi:hypothetical protein
MDQSTLAKWYRRNRARTRTLSDLLSDETYFNQPIGLRHPIVFYEGHLPARGIDPTQPDSSARLDWPRRDVAFRLKSQWLDPVDQFALTLVAAV